MCVCVINSEYPLVGKFQFFVTGNIKDGIMGLILLFIMCTVCYELVNITTDACVFFFCYLSFDF